MYILWQWLHSINVYYEQKIKGYVGGVESGAYGCIQSNVTHVGGVKSDSKYIIHTCKSCNALYVEGVESGVCWVLRCVKCHSISQVGGVKSEYRAPQYKVMLVMSAVSKVVFIAIHRVMLLMSDMSKVTQNTL